MSKWEKQRKEREGLVFINTQGCKGVIVKYVTSQEVYVKFENCPYDIKTSYSYVQNGSIKNPYHPTCYGVGYLGVGKYKPCVNGKKTIAYTKWTGMMERCYAPKYKNSHASKLKTSSVCEYWHNFQNFAEWHEKNYYGVDEEIMCLDKDILVKNNRVYSPETCIYVPNRINIMFTKSEAARGDLPIGVTLHKKRQIYGVKCSGYYVGEYKNIQDAFNAYKQFKENYIKQIANEYIHKIPNQLYEAMINYEVEITD